MRLPRSKRRFYALALFVCLCYFLSSCEINPLALSKEFRWRKNSTEALPVISEIAQKTSAPAFESKELEAFILRPNENA